MNTFNSAPPLPAGATTEQGRATPATDVGAAPCQGVRPAGAGPPGRTRAHRHRAAPPRGSQVVAKYA
ncbi:hypothetical protein ATKI12_8329 [Kitasatospora sp. Ki12]